MSIQNNIGNLLIHMDNNVTIIFARNYTTIPPFYVPRHTLPRNIYNSTHSTFPSRWQKRTVVEKEMSQTSSDSGCSGLNGHISYTSTDTPVTHCPIPYTLQLMSKFQIHSNNGFQINGYCIHDTITMAMIVRHVG